jgi:6-phosphogluconate dehydrogenase
MQIGLIGLGVMGRNLSVKMADHGFSVAGYEKDPGKVEALNQESEAQDIVNGALEAATVKPTRRA